jgi:LmbE family N-acetylglucosaminyl deacetylase
MKFHPFLRLLAVTPLAAPLFNPLAAQPAETAPAAATISPTLQDLHNFREMGRVLYVAAHPDDENTQLITYLARGRGYRTAYLSVTRGDGGQNLLGPEFGSTLGLARTEELLAARRLDGGLQFFTRALDFGFSKDVRETLNNWDRQQVVGDIVRVIRTFQPDVIITRFSPQPGGTHGHHTASAVLGIEAFKLAGDPKAFPEQLTTLKVWQPKRILQNGGGGGPGRGAPSGPLPAGAIRIEAGGNDPVTGEAFGSIAGRSRAMHKTQGFGNFGGGGGGPRQEMFTLLDGAPATTDIMDGVDTTWARLPGGAEMGPLIDDIIAKFKADDPAASVPALLVVRGKLAALPASPIVNDKREQLDHLLQECLGLSVETVVPQAEVVAGESLKLQESVTISSRFPVKWLAVRYAASGDSEKNVVTLQPGQAATRSATATLPANTVVSQPYWLREEGTAGMFRVDEANLIGRPENPPAFPVEYVFEVGGQTLVVADEPVQVISGATPETSRRRLEVIPPVSVRFASAVKLFALSAAQPIEVELTAARAGSAGKLELDVPAGWKVTPASQDFRLAKIGAVARFSFTLTAPAQSSTARVKAFVNVDGKRYGNERNLVSYGHIPVLLLQPQAKLKAVSVDLAVRSKNIGYLPGAGDTVAESIEQMGCKVTMLTGADLTPEKLKAYDAVVIGVRAFNTRTDLVPNLPGLFAYVEAGGTVIAQYNRPGRDLKTDQPAPYPLHITDERVTDENAPVLILAPENPALNVPNKINPGDFDGWIQERGSYYPNTWDSHFTPILASGDPGEQPLQGGLLIAHHGKGYFVYTGLSFFRQLPDGVPGAYRLFANLLSLGK